ncbi:Uncharacterized protein HZ326_29051 [Fusarium oxysporum f. sp. albedinis]|nr:Uncharacterized protein HZ326_29051 [Fusarium oxysporum f. sp. albedinis]
MIQVVMNKKTDSKSKSQDRFFPASIVSRRWRLSFFAAMQITPSPDETTSDMHGLVNKTSMSKLPVMI